MASEPQCWVFWTQYVEFNVCTEFHQNRLKNGRLTALQWHMQLVHAKLGWNAPWRGENPHFGEARSSRNYQTMMCLSHLINWSVFCVNRRRSVCGQNFTLSPSQSTLKIRGFWGATHPLSELPDFFSPSFCATHQVASTEPFAMTLGKAVSSRRPFYFVGHEESRFWEKWGVLR
jgi:hypothetical protein